MPELKQFDVVVIGAGPGGLAAANAAASRGKRVALLDDNAAAGGQIWRAKGGELQPQAERWLARLKKSGVEFLPNTSVVAAPETGVLLAERGNSPVWFCYGRLILATGSRELFLPFPGWTLPGVYGAGGLQALVKSGLPVKGKHIVVAGSGPLLLAVAAFLRERGAEIMCIAEQAPAHRVHRFALNLLSRPSKLAQGIWLRTKLAHVPYDHGWYPVRAEGDERVASVTLTNGTRERAYACEMLACGFGLVPNTELAEHLGCELDSGFVRVNAAMETTVPGVFAIGELAGIGGAESAITQGRIAGAAAAGAKVSWSLQFSRRRWKRFSERMAAAFALRDGMRGEVGEDTPVCRCEDATLRQLRACSSWRDAKLQTRVGMGPCQGRICGAACTYLLGWRNTSVRPPVLPARVATLLAEPPGRT